MTTSTRPGAAKPTTPTVINETVTLYWHEPNGRGAWFATACRPAYRFEVLGTVTPNGNTYLGQIDGIDALDGWPAVTRNYRGHAQVAQFVANVLSNRLGYEVRVGERSVFE